MESIKHRYQLLHITLALALCLQCPAANAVINHIRFNTDDGSISVRSFGAKGDGTQNDSAAFENAIKSASLTRKVLFVPAGRYKISGLVVYPNSVITGIPGSSVLVLSSGTQNNRQCMLLTAISQNVTLKNLMFDANGANNAGKNIQCIVTRLGAKDLIDKLVISNCGFTGSKNYGALFLIGPTDHISNTMISGCKFYNTGSSAVSVRGVNNFTFTNNTISSWDRLDKNNAAFSFQSQVCTHIKFTKNNFKNTDAAYFAIECAGTDVVKGKFTGNMFDGNGHDASGISGSFNNCLFKNNRHINGGGSHRSGYELVGDNDTIADNIIEHGSISLGTGVPGMAFARGGSAYIVTGNMVSGNYGNNNNCLSIGGVDTVKGALIQNNTFDNTKGMGNAPCIEVGQRGAAINVIIKNNKLSGAPGNACIRLKVSTGNAFAANISITGNTMAGDKAIQVFGMSAWKKIDISDNDLNKITGVLFDKQENFSPEFIVKGNITNNNK